MKCYNFFNCNKPHQKLFLMSCFHLRFHVQHEASVLNADFHYPNIKYNGTQKKRESNAILKPNRERFQHSMHSISIRICWVTLNDGIFIAFYYTFQLCDVKSITFNNIHVCDKIKGSAGTCKTDTGHLYNVTS